MSANFFEKYKSFKEAGGSAPVLYTGAKIAVNEGEFEVIMTSDSLDLDGETINMKGGRIHRPENGIPMIDSHNSHSSVTENGLGAVRDPRFVEENGKSMLKGTPDFAPTPKGEIAKILYYGVNGGKPYFTDTSMGFFVYDYDNKTRSILEWEIFELSLVTVGANVDSQFVRKSGGVQDVQLAKDLARFKQIKDPFKEFSRTFLSNEFCKMLGYEKDGDMLVDINNVYDILKQRLQVIEKDSQTTEAPKPQEVKSPTTAEVEKALSFAISEKIKKAMENNLLSS